MSRTPLLLRALRWRAGAVAALLVVATIAVLAATAGPLYFGAALGSVLHSTLAAASPEDNGITVVPQTSNSGYRPFRSASMAVASAHLYGLGKWYAPPITTLVYGAETPKINPNGNYYESDLVARTGVCSHLHFVAGACPTAVDQVAITSRTATALQVGVGGKIPILGLRGGELMATVTGVVSVASDTSAYWFGQNFFTFGPPPPPTIVGVTPLPRLDSLFTPTATLLHLSPNLTLQFPLLRDRVTVSNAPALQGAYKGYAYAVSTRDNALASTGIVSELRSVSNQEDQMLAVVVVVDLQLVLLTLFVLYGVVSRTAEARQKEVALAKLHGYRVPTVMTTGLAEPVIVICCALPLGMLLAWLAVVIASPLLLHGARVFFYPLVLWAGLVAFAGGLLATLLGARRIMTRRLVEELQASEPRSSNAARAAADGAAIALAVAGLVELAFSGVLNGKTPNPLALFAPGLIAVAVAVAGVRLLPVLCSVAVRQTLNSRYIATALAVRQVIRRPANLRQIVVLAVATGLATFAVAGWAVAGTNRVTRANFITGAGRVLDVHVPQSVNLVDAVRRADPSGRYAMAAVESLTPSQNLLAVDAVRLARVTDWPTSNSSTSLRDIVRWLTPRLTPPLDVGGTQVQMVVDLATPVSPPPDLQFSLIDAAGYPGVADFGYLSPGVHSYIASLPSACIQQCRVTNLTPYWTASANGPQQATYSLSVSDLEQQKGSSAPFRPVPGDIQAAGYWKSAGIGAAVVQSDTSDPVFTFTDTNQDVFTPAVIPAPLPGTLPGVTTSGNQVSDPADVTVEDFDGTTLALDTPITTSALPELGQYGFLMNLPTALRAETSPEAGSTNEVWVAPHTPRRVISALKAQGLRIYASQVPATLLARLNGGGLALAFQFFLFAAGAAALLAIGAAVFSIFVTARRRAFELAVLRVGGITRRTLARSLLGEQLLVLGPGVILGAGAGILGAVIALPSVPEFTSVAGGPPPQFPLPVLPLVALLLSLVVLLALAATLASLGTIGMAGYDRLRTEII
ncbi:MAG: FtsX-like permease family protein [Candidatus Dormiibacterota bacterium]